MTTEVPRPESLVLRLPEQALLDGYSVSLRRLRAAVAGEDREWPQSLAMAWLFDSDFPNKHRDYENILLSREASAEARCAAASYLGRIGSAAAQEILIAGLEVEDHQVSSAVLAALAQQGGPAAFDAIMGSAAVGRDELREGAHFALAAIASRHDLEPFDLPTIEEGARASYPAHGASDLRVECADPVEVELCLRCLGPSPFSIELAERPAYQIRCGNDLWMILLNRSVAMAGSVGELLGRKHLAGLVAKRSPIDGGYVSALVILAGPRAANGVQILVYRPSGRLAMAGLAAMADDSGRFSLRSMPGPRAFTIDIEGDFAAEGLTFRGIWLGPGLKRETVRTPSPHNRMGHAD